MKIYDIGSDEMRPATQGDIDSMQQALIGGSHLRSLVSRMLAPGDVLKLGLTERSKIQQILETAGL